MEMEPSLMVRTCVPNG